jgi:hypothetical protein
LTDEEKKQREDGADWKDAVTVEAGFCGLEAAGCCLLNALTSLALLLSTSMLLLNR